MEDEFEDALDGEEVEDLDGSIARGKAGIENHPMVYLTDDILNYEPRENDVFMIAADGSKSRMIYGEPCALDEEEIVKWNDFLAKYPDIPEFYKGETRFGLRYCIANYWNMELSYEQIKSHE